MAQDNELKVQNAVQDGEMLITVQDVMYILRSNIIAIIVMGIIGGVIFGTYTKLCIKPQYRSTARMYVISSSDNSLIQLSELELGSRLAADYVEMMMSRPMLEEVIAELSLENVYTASTLSGHITIDNPQDTRILNVVAQCDSPELAADIANTLAEVSAKNLSDIMETAQPKVFQRAIVDPRKISPNNSKNTLIGVVLGAALAIGLAVLLYILDDTIKTEEDIERYADLANFATISDAPDSKRKSNKKRKSGYYAYAPYGKSNQ